MMVKNKLAVQNRFFVLVNKYKKIFDKLKINFYKRLLRFNPYALKYISINNNDYWSYCLISFNEVVRKKQNINRLLDLIQSKRLKDFLSFYHNTFKKSNQNI